MLYLDGSPLVTSTTKPIHLDMQDTLCFLYMLIPPNNIQDATDRPSVYLVPSSKKTYNP